MSIKEELNRLKDIDIWSLLLFVLTQVKDVPEYSALSELCYILDKKQLFKLCEYFGGTTLTIPTIEELETLVYALLFYQYTDIEHLTYEDASQLISARCTNFTDVKKCYNRLRSVVSEYSFTPRGRSV